MTHPPYPPTDYPTPPQTPEASSSPPSHSSRVAFTRSMRVERLETMSPRVGVCPRRQRKLVHLEGHTIVEPHTQRNGDIRLLHRDIWGVFRQPKVDPGYRGLVRKCLRMPASGDILGEVDEGGSRLTGCSDLERLVDSLEMSRTIMFHAAPRDTDDVLESLRMFVRMKPSAHWQALYCSATGNPIAIMLNVAALSASFFSATLSSSSSLPPTTLTLHMREGGALISSKIDTGFLVTVTHTWNPGGVRNEPSAPKRRSAGWPHPTICNRHGAHTTYERSPGDCTMRVSNAIVRRLPVYLRAEASDAALVLASGGQARRLIQRAWLDCSGIPVPALVVPTTTIPISKTSSSAWTQHVTWEGTHTTSAHTVCDRYSCAPQDQHDWRNRHPSGHQSDHLAAQPPANATVFAIVRTDGNELGRPAAAAQDPAWMCTVGSAPRMDTQRSRDDLQAGRYANIVVQIPCSQGKAKNPTFIERCLQPLARQDFASSASLATIDGGQVQCQYPTGKPQASYPFDGGPTVTLDVLDLPCGSSAVYNQRLYEAPDLTEG
ncbi:hypothetical protein NMY22_g983 [Coprinellus aureogranulatus]|nr:hypothetical protein NMY22_g983 [Coprinellus aureogranulatus]